MKLRKSKHIVFLILLLVITISLGVISVSYFNSSTNKSDVPTSTKKNNVQLDENGKAVDGEFKPKSSNEVLLELQKEQVNVTDKISSSALFHSGAKGSIGSWVVENLESNNVIMQCEIYLDDKVLAISVPVYPNEHIESISLLEDIKPGTYDVVAYINYFKLDSKEYISKAGYKIKLVVR